MISIHSNGLHHEAIICETSCTEVHKNETACITTMPENWKEKILPQVLTTEKAKKRLTVTFDNKYEVCPNISFEDYSEAELIACWYSEEEGNAIKRECLKIVKKMQAGKPISARKYSACGLEPFTPEGSDRRDLNKMNAYIAVLEEQERQRAGGFFSARSIAKQYRSAASKQAHKEAAKRAERDAMRRSCSS